MILYSGPLSMFGAKVQIAMLEKGIDFQLVMVPYDREQRLPAATPRSAAGQSEAAGAGADRRRCGDFRTRRRSSNIWRTRSRQLPLWPREPAARAAARQLEMKSDEVYFPHIIRLMGLQDRPDDPAAVAARDAASRYYLEMEARLADRQWLAGDYTFADIAFYMAALFGERMGAVVGQGTPNLLAWRERMTSRPAVRPVVSAMAGYLSSQGRPVPGWLDAAAR